MSYLQKVFESDIFKEINRRKPRDFIVSASDPYFHIIVFHIHGCGWIATLLV